MKAYKITKKDCHFQHLLGERGLFYKDKKEVLESLINFYRKKLGHCKFHEVVKFHTYEETLDTLLKYGNWIVEEVEDKE